MRPSELEAFFRNADIPMKLVFGRSFEKIMKASDRGPVFYGMRYGSAPRRKGTPTENGFARPFPPLRRGATQVGSPETRHAVVMLGYLHRRDASGTLIATDVFRKEPNHGSPSRPEKPPFDKIFAHQAKREYEDYHDRLGLDLYAAVTKKGFESPEG
jgi:hypothetical protein